jgi:hypothetical protein
MPTLSEIALLEEALPSFIANKSGQRHPASAYCRQYVGLISRGRKIIYVNALIASDFEERNPDALDWKKVPMMVCDGGADFLGLDFDPLTKHFQRFAANGEA